MEGNLVVIFKIKAYIYDELVILSPEIYLLKRNENIWPHKNLHMDVQSGIFHNDHKVEIILMSINRINCGIDPQRDAHWQEKQKRTTGMCINLNVLY